MKVFLSWSGDHSKAVARALREWLPDVIQSLRPWMSDKDLEAGVRWSAEIESELKASSFGIVCVTPENRFAPWLNFEAGAISNNLGNVRVVPFIHGMGFADIQGPLTQFQAKEANELGVLELVQALNAAAAEQGLDRVRLGAAFARLWPELELQLNAINIPAPSIGSVAVAQRPESEKLDEMLVLTRRLLEQSERKKFDKERSSLNRDLMFKINTVSTAAKRVLSRAKSQDIPVKYFFTFEDSGDVCLVFTSPVELSSTERETVVALVTEHGAPPEVRVDFIVRP